MRVLVVEDAEDVCEAIMHSLKRAGHTCDAAGTLEDSRAFVAVQEFDAIVLDMNLPDGSGYDLLKEIRSAGGDVAVLMLTARFGIDDRVDALDAGADDYLVKPFDMRELEARLRAVIRRRYSETDAVLAAGDVTLNTATREVTVGGRACDLTRRELSLLELLITARGRVIPKEEIHSRLFAMNEDTNLNAVELYVARLRRKIGDSSLTIRTLRGLGYQAVVAEGARND